ncbi:hypothetical protein H8S90_10040 [Olivibacter sp. SDN3]|uniref:DUF6194 family protein n=1 Tax=Olivibacter sp. SDN3 TaxID=2764720 RepID=UPI001650DB29|nr:DUF6194 family protein [Olivibacter sp. SDN3]QNL51882.1 hypothetical protein H8S90_10040 [Olivibacter sp. SDN3]
MSLQKIENHISKNLHNVQKLDSFGYNLFFYGTDHVLPFISIAKSDNEYDSVSNLNRDGVFRVNIGVSKETFNKLFANSKKEWDFTELNSFMPHPHYAAQNFICILNPLENNLIYTINFIEEAYAIAKNRFDKKHSIESKGPNRSP